MKVEIFSTNAAVAGTPFGTTWSGEVEVNMNLSDEVILDLIYRMFNRVDEADLDRMEALGYELPSLSMGDFVTLHGGAAHTWGEEHPRTYQVAAIGFALLTGTETGSQMLLRARGSH